MLPFEWAVKLPHDEKFTTANLMIKHDFFFVQYSEVTDPCCVISCRATSQRNMYCYNLIMKHALSIQREVVDPNTTTRLSKKVMFHYDVVTRDFSS